METTSVSHFEVILDPLGLLNKGKKASTVLIGSDDDALISGRDVTEELALLNLTSTVVSSVEIPSIFWPSDHLMLRGVFQVVSTCADICYDQH